MQKTKVYIRLALLTSLLLAVWISSANAYSTYTTNGSDNCASCHGDFTASPYTSLADNVSWGDDMHDVHRNTMLGGNDCDACHTTGGRRPTFLGSSNGGNGLAAISCLGCHGRDEGAGVTGAGLRQHHFINGETGCNALGCHPGDSDPGVFTTVGENILPPYYATPGTGHPSMPTDPCNPSGGENFAATAIGLDNDGDNTYDQTDTDCQAASAPDINLNPANLNFGDVGSGNSSMLPTSVQNLGNADLNVTAIALCAGTSTEFTWLPAAPFTVTQGSSQNLVVTYAPLDAGVDTGCLVISSNDPDEPTKQLILNKSTSWLLYNPAIIRPNQTQTP